MHITASTFINDDESDLHHDYDAWLENMTPHEPTGQYRHNDTGEDNATHKSSGMSWGEKWWRRWKAGWISGRGADILWGVRWEQKEEAIDEDHWGVRATCCKATQEP